MNSDIKVSVLVSTYNGDLFLRRQIDSILTQTFKNFVILIRDDGSTDLTIPIIERYLNDFPNIFTLISDSRGNLGSTKSFLSMLQYVENGSYVMFSDQDDVWLDRKIELFVERIRLLEERSHDKELAAMIFGDMYVTDKDLKVVHSSFWNFQRINPNWIYNWERVLSQNVVTGCSLIFNYSAIKLLTEDQVLSVVHDHWVAINLSKFGLVDFLREPTMYYVQHQKNSIGAAAYNFMYIYRRLLKVGKTWSDYFEICQYFDMNFYRFIYYKLETGITRLFYISRS